MPEALGLDDVRDHGIAVEEGVWRSGVVIAGGHRKALDGVLRDVDGKHCPNRRAVQSWLTQFTACRYNGPRCTTLDGVRKTSKTVPISSHAWLQDQLRSPALDPT